MQCPKCGAPIKPEDQFCMTCGAKIERNNEPVIEQLVPDDAFINTPRANNFEDYTEDLVDAYIGKNVEKIRSGKFSLPMFFLGIFYILYRKMFLVAILIVVGNSILATFLPTVSGILTLGISIYLSISFNKIYLKTVRERVEKIEKENPGKSKEELSAICTKKGGVSVLAALIPSILFIVGVVVVTIIFSAALFAGLYEDSELYGDDTSYNIEDEEEDEGPFKGTIKYELPEGFEMDDVEESDTIYAYYTSEDLSNYFDCDVSIFYYEDLGENANFKTMIDEYAEEEYLTFTDAGYKYISGDNWYVSNYTYGSYRFTIQAINDNEDAYIIIYGIYADEGNVCLDSRTEFLESLDL